LFARRLFLALSLALFFGSFAVLVYFSLGVIYSFPLPQKLGWQDALHVFFFGILMMVTIRYLGLVLCSFLYSFRKFPEVGTFYPTLSIIVPAYNEEKVIEHALQALLSLDYPDYEIIVVDDGSNDRTFSLAQQMNHFNRAVPVRVFQQINMGKSAALNRGILVARGEVVLCVDGDSKVDPRALKQFIRHFVHPGVGAVAGNVKVLNRETLICRLQALEYIEGLNLLRRTQALFKAVSIVPGPIGLFRRQAILDVGGYDHDTFAEDCDLTFKLMRAGWLMEYQPEAIAWTEAPENLESLLKQRYRWTRGILQVISKHAFHWHDNKRPAAFLFWLTYMGIECALWPIINLSGFALFAYFMLCTNFGDLYWALWWFLLTFLDVLAAVYCISLENEDWALAPLAVIYRMFFSLMVDAAKLLATIEEIFNVRMDWGKLERKGRL
jgi:poly-beta-1,6-N-acetyl-D-glucosamine synthase